MKKIIILGSTGSIGENALRVVASLPGRFRVVGLGVHRDYRRALRQAVKFRVPAVAVSDPARAERCAADAPRGIRVYRGPRGLEALAGRECDIVLCAVVGVAGLRPVLRALECGRDVALATKEVLVAAGPIVVKACRRHGGRLLPVDSEHSAVFQCLDRAQPGRRPGAGRPALPENRHDVRRLILTASGGPFGSRPRVDLDAVRVAEALAHPRWRMGRKVTVDSATLMNKGLEVMEAHWLFGVPLDRIAVMIHPESLVHSLVEFVDGSLLAQLSVPDMRFAIQYALTWPERADAGLPRLDLAKAGPLHFREPDEKRFPCLALAREAGRRGGTMPAVLNAANEIAVGRFLQGRIPFPGIWRLVEAIMRKHDAVPDPDLEEVLEADRWARRAAEESAGEA